MLEGPADVARGHGSELALLETPVPAGHLSKLGGPRAYSLAQAAAVRPEMEEPVQRDPEELQLVSRDDCLPCDLDGAVDCVAGPLREHQRLGLLAGHRHLGGLGPLDEGVRSSLSPVPGDLDAVPGTESRGVIGVEERSRAGGPLQFGGEGCGP